MINETELSKFLEKLDFLVSIVVNMCIFSEKILTYQSENIVVILLPDKYCDYETRTNTPL